MSDRDRARDRERDRDRDRDRDRERRRGKDDRDRERDRDRDRDRGRIKRSRTPELSRSRHTRSRTRSPDRRHHHRTPSPEPPRKRHRRDEDEKDRQRAAVEAVSDFVDSIAKEKHKLQKDSDGVEGLEGGGEMDADEVELMKSMGIPVGFDSTKGKPVPGADVSGVRAVTKRQPRQYMNRRGGFNRPLPAEQNR